MSMSINLCRACVVYSRFPLFATQHSCLVPERCECVCIHVNVIDPTEQELKARGEPAQPEPTVTFVGGQERRTPNGGNDEQPAGAVADAGSGAQALGP